MSEESNFLQLIQSRPDDHSTRLIYADWLEERGDVRGEFLRLQLDLRYLAPDHLHRVSGEMELSELRAQIDPEWLRITEPDIAQLISGEERRPINEDCFERNSRGKFRETYLHTEVQDTECDGWKQLLDYVEDCAAGEVEVFDPFAVLKDRYFQILTLPPTMAKLKSVIEIRLYGSNLVRLPPEIGEMENLHSFDPYTSYRLHWFPYELTHCRSLASSRISTRALYGNYKYRLPFPRLKPGSHIRPSREETQRLYLRRHTAPSTRKCSVCQQPFEDQRQHRAWISLWVGTDTIPLLVNACSKDCINDLPKPPEHCVPRPHQGGKELEQPPPRF